MNNFGMPYPPGYPMYTNQSYTSDGRQITMDIYPAPQQTMPTPPVQQYPLPQQQYYPQPQPPIDFGSSPSVSSLVGTSVTIGSNNGGVSMAGVVTEDAKRGRPRKKKDKETSTELTTKTSTEVSDPAANSAEIVNNTVYADTYTTTNALTYNIIAQSDELLKTAKQDLDWMRAQRNLKGKFHYINNTMATMSSLLGTKLQAIKELNSTIKNANDAEYRRYKDMRAIAQVDDNKAIMDAYSAFISAPIGAPVYQQPGTMNLTGGMNGVIRADYPPDVQQGVDAGMANFLANMTPEEHLMIADNNPNLEEVLIYDEATGIKRFGWIDTSTGQPVPNMPASSNLVVEDFAIDPRTHIARNTNLNMVKKVVTLNEGKFDRY